MIEDLCTTLPYQFVHFPTQRKLKKSKDLVDFESPHKKSIRGKGERMIKYTRPNHAHPIFRIFADVLPASRVASSLPEQHNFNTTNNLP